MQLAKLQLHFGNAPYNLVAIVPCLLCNRYYIFVPYGKGAIARAIFYQCFIYCVKSVQKMLCINSAGICTLTSQILRVGSKFEIINNKRSFYHILPISLLDFYNILQRQWKLSGSTIHFDMADLSLPFTVIEIDEIALRVKYYIRNALLFSCLVALLLKFFEYIENACFEESYSQVSKNNKKKVMNASKMTLHYFLHSLD